MTNNLTPNFFGINLVSPSPSFSYFFEPTNSSFITAQGHLITIYRIFHNYKTISFKAENPIKAICPLYRGNHFITIESPSNSSEVYCSIYSISYTSNSITFINSTNNLLLSNNETPSKAFKHYQIIDITYKNDFLIKLTPSNSNDSSLLYHININTHSYEMTIIRRIMINIPNMKVKNAVMNWKDNLLYCINKHNLFITELNHRKVTSIQAETKLNMNNNLIYKCSSLIYIKESINSQTQAKYIVVLISSGNCILYHPYTLTMVYDIHFEDYYVNSINYNSNNNTLCCNTMEGCVFVIDVFSLQTKYTIDYMQIRFVAPIFQSFIEEQQDKLVILFNNGNIIKGNLSNILKGIPNSCAIITSFHNGNSNINIACIAQQRDSNLGFYSCCNGNDIIKWYYRGDRWVNKKYSFDKDIIFTYIKFHPKYQTTLFAGDSLGNIYIFKIEENNTSIYDDNNTNFNNNTDNNNTTSINDIAPMHRCKGATCSINDITFNNDNPKLIGISYINGMNIIYKIDNINSIQSFSFESLLKLSDEFNNIEYNINNHSSHYPSFMCFNENQVTYLKNSNTIMREDINYINNSLFTETNKQISYSKYNALIKDIKLHYSEKYLFILLNTNQIDIRHIETFHTNGIIDIGENIKNFTFDYTGDFIIINCIDKIIIYNICKMKEYERIDIGIIDIENVSFLESGKYIIISNSNGSLYMVDTPKRLKSKIFNYKDKEKEKGINVMKSQFILNVDKNVYKLKLKKHKEIIYDTIKEEVNENVIINESIHNENEKKNVNDVHIHNVHINDKQNENDVSSSKVNYLNEYKYSPSKTAESIRNKQQVYNTQWDKQHQYTRLGYTSRDTYLSINKDPSIFPINQHPTLERINHKLIEGKSLRYPDMAINLVENESKRQQDNIRAININNAIYNMMQQPQQSNQMISRNVNGSCSQIEKTDEMKMQFETDKEVQNKQYNTSSLNIDKTNNSNYYINNNRIDKPGTIRQQYNEPDTIDNMSVTNNNNNPVNTYSNFNVNYNSTNSNNNYNYNCTTNSYGGDNNKYNIGSYNVDHQNVNTQNNQKDVSDFSIISTFSNHNMGKYSIADDIDYLCEGIDKFENDNQKYIN